MDSRGELSEPCRRTGPASQGVDRWLLCLRWRELWLDHVAARTGTTSANRTSLANSCRELLEEMLESAPEPLPPSLAATVRQLLEQLGSEPAGEMGREELQRFDQAVHALHEWLTAPLRAEAWRRRPPAVSPPQ